MSVEKLKPLSTVDLLLSALGLIKSGALVFGLLMLEWGRKKEAQAKLEAKAIKNDLDVERATNATDKQTAGRSPESIVDDFLAGPK